MVEGILAGVGMAAGLVGAAWGVYVTRSYSTRCIAVEMNPGYRLSPASLGIGGSLRITYNNQSVGDLRVFFLKIRNCSKRDILEETNPSRKAAGVIFPHIEFTGFRIVGYHTLENDQEKFYIPLSRSHNDTKLWLNIQKIRKGRSAEFQIVCVPEEHIAEEERSFGLRVGYVPDMRIKTPGILEVLE